MQKPFYAKRDSDKEVEDMFKALDQELDDMKKAARGVVPQGDTDWKYLEDAVLETKKRNLRYKNVFKEYNAFRSKVAQNVGWAQSKSQNLPAYAFVGTLNRADALGCFFPPIRLIVTYS